MGEPVVERPLDIYPVPGLEGEHAAGVVESLRLAQRGEVLQPVIDPYEKDEPDQLEKDRAARHGGRSRRGGGLSGARTLVRASSHGSADSLFSHVSAEDGHPRSVGEPLAMFAAATPRAGPSGNHHGLRAPSLAISVQTYASLALTSPATTASTSSSSDRETARSLTEPGAGLLAAPGSEDQSRGTSRSLPVSTS